MSPRAQRWLIGAAAGLAAFVAGLHHGEAGPRHHHRHHHHRVHYGLVASINAKLARYVHPTGRCAGQEWLATYYGYESGRHTASGQTFHPLGISAAHRTLPFGTRLRVTNPHNGRSVSVTVNDRGPFTHAKIDLSLGAARSIGMTQSSYVCIEG